MYKALSGSGTNIVQVGSNIPSEIINKANLVAYYDFKNPTCYPGSGTAVTDLSNRANNGTITVVGTGTYAFGTDRQRKLVFNTAAISGSNNVSVLSTAGLADFGIGTGSFAIECWIKFNALRTTDDTSAAAVAETGTSGVRIITDTVLSPARLLYQIGGSTIISGTASSIAINTWYHVVFSRIGTACTTFLNGVSNGTATSSANAGANGRLTAGVNAANAARRINGDYGAIRVYKGRGLTAAEVSKNYNLERIYYI
jgi:hypothetical protein